MEETRVERFKEYRNSFVKEGSIATDEGGQTTTINVKGTTTTLPIKDVMGAAKEDEIKTTLLQQSKRKHIAIIVVKILVSVLLLAGLVVLGYFAWRK